MGAYIDDVVVSESKVSTHFERPEGLRLEQPKRSEGAIKGLRVS